MPKPHRRRARAALAATPPLVVLAVLVAAGCHAGVRGATSGGPASPADDRLLVGAFRPVTGVEAPPPDRSARLAEAVVGTVADAGDGLGTRHAVRPLRMPKPAPGATARFDFDGGKRGWVTGLPRKAVLTSPAYGHGKVFIGGGFASHRFFAFDAFDGELDWSLAAPDGGPTAAILEDRAVIFNTESCTLFVADADTGALRWKRWLGDPLMSQPAAADGLVVSAYPASGGHRFGAFKLSDGSPVWDVPIPADVIQAPQIVGGAAFFATMDGTVHRVRLEDGRVAFSRRVGASSAVWVDGDRMLLARRVDDGGQAFEEPVVLDATSGRLVRASGHRVPASYLAGTSRDRQLVQGQAGAWGSVPHGDHLGLRNVAAGWAFQGSSPAIADGRAYFAVGGEVRAREIATGAEVWKRRYRDAGDAQAVSPPAVVGSLLFFGTVDGQLFAADIDTGMTLFAYDVGEPIVFQPIVAQGWVYVATGEGRLVGLEVGDAAALDGWHMWGGNARHAGLVDAAGTVDPALLASLARPGQGTLEVAAFESAEASQEAEAPDAVDDDDDRAGEGLDAPLPLLSTRVTADVSGPVARVRVHQVFENPNERPIEARYLFPLPEDAAVDAMQMRFDGRVVEGRIKRRRAARETYEAARREGKRAALLEQQRPNLFAQRVANVPPRERIEVTIEYVQLVPFAEGAYELRYPMVAGPRFDPGDPAAVLPPARTLRAADEVGIEVHLDAGLPLGAVGSPSHRVTIDRRDGGRHADIALASGEGVPNRDFVLRYGVVGATPRATVLTDSAGSPVAGGAEGHLTLLIQPPEVEEGAAVVVPRDVVFLVDASSSMRGLPLAHAKAVVRAVAEGLRPDDRVGVVAFSDRVTTLGGGLLPAGTETAGRVRAFLDRTRATGSTVMAPAVGAALSALGDASSSNRLPMLVLLTDGFVGNEADVLRDLVGGLGEARVHTVGLGPAPNAFLLRRAAELGRGRVLLPALSDLPVHTAARFAEMIDRPVFTDIEIDWGGLEVADVHPRRVPDLFAGKPLVVHARYAEGGTAQVAVRGTWGGRRHERVVDVTLEAGRPAPPSAVPAPRPAHASLWARAAVRERANRGFLRPDPELAEQIAGLGLAYRLVTSETSFVAVETDDRAPDDGPEGASVPTRATVSPARALPGDPEIRIPAPADARAVTVILPFGETLEAVWEAELSLWTARFLIPDDADEGSYGIEILVTHGDGVLERLRTGYTVDASAPALDVEVLGPAIPGQPLRIRATQRLTEADLAQAGFSRRTTLSASRVALLQDVRRVEVRAPGSGVVGLSVAGPGVWEGTVPVPVDAAGTLELAIFVADLAANVTSQQLTVEVVRGGR